ncbi:hypothetical protein [Planctobacterium marinum]|uniref:Class IIb bacteriocin, lactobin A/cerein 7B family n=1 Tax=Planctobacterium marinum TaxID=1631968 RepID=A0AA48HY33_9ALTE|nr:hypothetical protein MACH26_35140 [Planctobacterium marinum]
MQELTLDELNQVNGGVLVNALAAITGAVGAIVGTIIGGGNDVDAEDIVLAGVAGAVNSVRSLVGAVKLVGGSVAGGGTVNVIRDVIDLEFSGS